MNVQKTLIIVKPAVTADLILSKKAEVEILKLGYTIIAKKRCHLSLEQAYDFYSIKNGKGQEDSMLELSGSELELLEDFSKGPNQVYLLAKTNAIESCLKDFGLPPFLDTHVQKQWITNYKLKSVQQGFYISNVAPEAQIRFFFPETFADIVPEDAQSAIFLEQHVYPTLNAALTALCKEKPKNPTEWLGKWLLENNPQQPNVKEPN